MADTASAVLVVLIIMTEYTCCAILDNLLYTEKYEKLLVCIYNVGNLWRYVNNSLAEINLCTCRSGQVCAEAERSADGAKMDS